MFCSAFIVKMLLFNLVLAFGVHVYLCLSDQAVCTSNQTQNGTFYSVPDVKAEECHYYWINNSSNIATFVSKNDMLVKSANMTSLHTYGCHPEINYSRNCLSKGGKITTTCSTNCSGFAALKQPDPGNKQISDAVTGESVDVGIVIAVVVVIALCILLLIGYLYHRHKPNLSRCCNRPTTAANRQNGSPGHPDVEAQETRETFL